MNQNVSMIRLEYIFMDFSIISGKKHYNEFHAVKMARALMNESEDEDDNKSVDELGKVSDDPEVSDAGGATPEEGEGGEKSKGDAGGRGSGSNSPMDTEPIQ